MSELEQALERGSVRLESVGIDYLFTRSLGMGAVDADALRGALPAARQAAEAVARIVETGETAGMSEPVKWFQLGEDAPEGTEAVKAWAAETRAADVIVSVGIGGSYLGNRVLRDALLGPGFNAFPRAARRDAPELHFAGFHLDPHQARELVALLAAKAAAKPDGPLRVVALAISKSGGTTETLATTLALLASLDAAPGIEASLSALTAPGSGLAVLAEGRPDSRIIPFPAGIGGRFSVLSPVGLVTAAVSGVSLDELLAGARAARDECLAGGGELARNPALLYALIHHLHAEDGRRSAVFMPYAERLRGVSEWYVQLLAESLGKARDRQGTIVNTGRTPIVAVGTTDMHAQTQQHQEGTLDKTVTTLDVRDWGPATPADRVPELESAGKLAGKSFAWLNTLAREANEEALASTGRPSDALILDRLDARTLGGLLTTLMLSVCYEGELLDTCTYDQPGVEAYKKIMKARL